MKFGKFIMDERSKGNLEETATAVLALFYVVCTIEMLIKLIVTHEYLSIVGELVILLSVSITFSIVQRFHSNYSPMLPRKNNGEELSAERTLKSKLNRMFTYGKEAIIFAIGLRIFSIALDYFLKKQTMDWSLAFFSKELVNIVLAAIVFFIINAIWKERRIKKYNKWNETMEE